jgi:hypothetical protein
LICFEDLYFDPSISAASFPSLRDASSLTSGAEVGAGAETEGPSIGAETAGAEVEGGRDDPADDEEGRPKSKEGGNMV